VLMYAGILLKPYPSSRGLGHWIPALAEAHVLILLLAVIGGVGLLVRGRGVRRAPLVPTLLFVLGFMLLNVRVSQMKPLYVSDVLAPIAALAAAAAALAAWRHAPVLARPAMTAIVAAALLAGLWNLGAPRTNRPWRRSLQDLAQRFAGQRLLVTPRAAGAMVIYYLNASDVLLDSNEPDDRAALERAVEARRIDAVFQWGGSVEPGGVAAETIAKGPPDGRATISASIVSWWRLSRP